MCFWSIVRKKALERNSPPADSGQDGEGSGKNLSTTVSKIGTFFKTEDKITNIYFRKFVINNHATNKYGKSDECCKD